MVGAGLGSSFSRNYIISIEPRGSIDLVRILSEVFCFLVMYLHFYKNMVIYSKPFVYRLKSF